MLPRFLAFFSARFSFSDFCATFFWSFFGFSDPFMPPSYDVRMSTTLAPRRVEQPVEHDEIEPDRPWIVLVWNDPINLMSYVTLVFQKLFGYSRPKATELMLQVHNEGKAVVSNGTREKAELDVARLHAHGLWATMRQD